MEMADLRAREILSKMSLNEKLFEMSGRGLLRFGGSVVFGKRVKAIKAGGQAKWDIPPTVFYDGPRGIALYKGTTAFPTTMARGASWDIDLEKRIGEAMAKENRALGGNYSGAVCMNLLRHPAWGRAQETYGEDQHHVGEMGSALVEGIQSHGVQACAKHFAANSMENNRFGGSMNMNLRTLHEVYLPHFKKVVDRGVASIMSAYNKLNGEFCGHHKYLLTDILRTQWGFKGYVTSDWMNGVYNTEKGIKAGMNVEMPSAKVYKPRKVKQSLNTGAVSLSDIDNLVLPIIRTKLLFAKDDTTKYPKALVGCAEHINLALEAAEKSAVLLKNEGNVLPFQISAVNKIAVLGSLAQSHETGDRGSSSVSPDYVVSPFDGLKSYLSHTGGEVLTASISDMDEFRRVCAIADAVVVVAGTSWKDEGEYLGVGKIRDRNNPDKKNFIVRLGVMGLGGDRAYLNLHENDIRTIQVAASLNKKVIVCLVAGAAVTVEEWHNQVPGIVQLFYNGMEGGTALARILFGEVNPSGKLPFSVPVSEDQLPPFDSYKSEVEYGYYHGYCLFDKQKLRPGYGFGYGLSYTNFEISEVTASIQEEGDKTVIKVTALVKNTGQKAGAEVVQCYVGYPQQGIDLPVKRLQAFAKVTLLPGQNKQIEMKIPVDALKYYNEALQSWQLQYGAYTIMVGNSADDAKGREGIVISLDAQ